MIKKILNKVKGISVKEMFKRKPKKNPDEPWFLPPATPKSIKEIISDKIDEIKSNKWFRPTSIISKFFLLYTALILMIVGFGLGLDKIRTLEKENAELKTQVVEVTNASAAKAEEDKKTIDELSSNVQVLTDNVKNYSKTVTEQTNTIATLKSDNESLASEYDKVKASYDKLKTRKELYDKYKYAIWYDGKRTDLTYDQITYGEDLCIKNGIDPNLLFSIGMVESRYNEKDISTCSTARGYHQFLEGTGKFTYEKLMKNGSGTYSHSMALNGKTNIALGVNYLKYLYNSTGEFYTMIRRYRGRQDISGYVGAMNSFLKQTNMTAEDVRKNMLEVNKKTKAKKK